MEDGAPFAGPDPALNTAAIPVIVPVPTQRCQLQPGAFLVKRAVACAAVVFAVGDALVAWIVIAKLA